MKHEIMVIDNEVETDPDLKEILDILRQRALYRRFDPEKPLTVRFKSEIFPITNKDTK